MASHHHHHHHPSTCCCCNCSCYSTPCPPPPSAAAAADPLVQAIATQLLQSHQLYSHHYLKSHLHHSPPPPPPPQHYHLRQEQHDQDKHQPHQHHQKHTLLQSLIRRVAALETSSPHLSSSSAASPSPPPPVKNRKAEARPSPPVTAPPPPPPPPARISLRDVAARTIQTQFRLYLVHRSQTLRHLKHLSTVRSQLAVLNSSLSDEESVRRHPGTKSLSQHVMDLLIQLDSIQSRDPMIREGKSSISRELVRILDYVEGVLGRRQRLSVEAMDKAETGGRQPASPEKSGRRSEESGSLSGVSDDDGEDESPENSRKQMQTSQPVKRVSFSGNGNGYHQEQFADEELAIGSSRVSVDDADENLEYDLANGFRYGMGGGSAPHGLNGNPHLGLYAPMPVKMEPRRSELSRDNGVIMP